MAEEGEGLPCVDQVPLNKGHMEKNACNPRSQDVAVINAVIVTNTVVVLKLLW